MVTENIRTKNSAFVSCPFAGLFGSFIERDSDLTGNKLRSLEQIILSFGVLSLVNGGKHLYQNTT